MNAPLLNLNSLIKKEADKILKEKGLFSILSSFGTPDISPVYILNHFLSAYFQHSIICSITHFFCHPLIELAVRDRIG